MVRLFRENLFSGILILSSAFSFANMAKPNVDGSIHSVLFARTGAEVKREWINVGILEKDKGSYYAKYSITYEIFCPTEMTIPLRFLGYDLFGNPVVLVNAQSVSTAHPVSAYDLLPQRAGIVFEPSDLFEFEARLKKGLNKVQVSYDANLEYWLTGLERKHTLRYALYPSQFWKSFGPIEINLNLPRDLELTASNIGVPATEAHALKFRLYPSEAEEMELSFVRKKSLLASILLFLQPGGIASIAFVLLGFGNIMLMRKYPRRSKIILWMGILIVPTVFYVVLLASYSWIDAALEQLQNHGYTFLIVFTWPLLALLYGWYLFRTRRRLIRSRTA